MAAAGRASLSGLLKQAYNEIPEVLCSTGLALLGIGFAVVGLRNYMANDGDNRKYKSTYVIMRPDDPRVKFVHCD